MIKSSRRKGSEMTSYCQDCQLSFSIWSRWV